MIPKKKDPQRVCQSQSTTNCSSLYLFGGSVSACSPNTARPNTARCGFPLRRHVRIRAQLDFSLVWDVCFASSLCLRYGGHGIFRFLLFLCSQPLLFLGNLHLFFPVTGNNFCWLLTAAMRRMHARVSCKMEALCQQVQARRHECCQQEAHMRVLIGTAHTCLVTGLTLETPQRMLLPTLLHATAELPACYSVRRASHGGGMYLCFGCSTYLGYFCLTFGFDDGQFCFLLGFNGS